MDQIRAFLSSVSSSLAGLYSQPIVDGQSIADVLTLDFLIGLLGNILAAILILVVGYLVAGWVSRSVRRISKGRDLDNTLFNFLATLARYAVLAFTLLFVLNTFGIQTTSIIAVIGAAGLAIGLALQGTLTNIAAGVMLILFRPIKEGDFVEVNGQMGTVKEISLNFTELASIGNVQIIIPNSEVWGNTITNYSVYPDRRAEWTFGVSYDAPLGKAEDVIIDTILSDDRSRLEPEPFIKVNNLGDSSVDFLVRVWCSSNDYFGYQADMKRRVKEALDEAGIGIPFPTRSLEILGLPEGADEEDTGGDRGGDGTARAEDAPADGDVDEDAAR